MKSKEKPKLDILNGKTLDAKTNGPFVTMSTLLYSQTLKKIVTLVLWLYVCAYPFSLLTDWPQNLTNTYDDVWLDYTEIRISCKVHLVETIFLLTKRNGNPTNNCVPFCGAWLICWSSTSTYQTRIRAGQLNDGVVRLCDD